MPIALLTHIHPSSATASPKILSSLQSASESYYHSPTSLCTTWSYFRCSTRPGALYSALTPSFPAAPKKSDSKSSKSEPKASSEPKLVISGLEIYTSPTALTTQQNEPWFKEYQRKVADEKLYAEGKGEEMKVWYPAGGFVSRKEREEGGKGVVVMLAVFECKDSGEAVERSAKILSDFAAWVKANEPGTLTYSVLTRPSKKNSDEVIMFERYASAADLGKHGASKEFRAMFKSLLPHIDPKKTKICEFEEIDGSFVGEGLPKKSKL